MALSTISLDDLQGAQRAVAGSALGFLLSYDGVEIEQVAPGFFIGALNMHTLVEPAEVEKYPSVQGVGSYAANYYVCDSPQQFIERYGSVLESADETYITFFTHIARVPGEEGGWRWHKWGEYIGDREPKNEYLADEDEEFAGGVHVVHISHVKF